MRFDLVEFVAIAREELAPSAHRRGMSVRHIDASEDEIGSLSYENEDRALVLIVDPQQRTVDLKFGRRGPGSEGSHRSIPTWPLHEGGRSVLQLGRGLRRRSEAPVAYESSGLRSVVRDLVARAELHSKEVFGHQVSEALSDKAVVFDTQWYGFIDLVVIEAASLIARHRLVPTRLFHVPRGTLFDWANARRTVSFQLETMEGYMDVVYGNDHPMPGGTSRLLGRTGSLRRILCDEGIAFPSGSRELYVPGGKATALRLLIATMERYEARVFGSDWDADGA
ncbi:hypothetical protein EON81_25185 [bacterium]|nr:MAG: hypothetical protein EON81_25185 [bacterium]